MGKIDNKLIVAGPCAVEKKMQLYNTVKHICNYTDVIRAGIWKGRTSPNIYPVVGEKALPWIQDIQNQYQIPVAIEVGNSKHVELALKYDIKINKQLNYANKRGVKFVVMIGEDEITNNRLSIKNMLSGKNCINNQR